MQARTTQLLPPLRSPTGILASLLFYSSLVAAQSLSDSVLVIYNSSKPQSRRVATHYVERDIPAKNVCPVKAVGMEEVPWGTFQASTKSEIQQCLTRVGKDKILYIVLAYGFPFALGSVPAGQGRSLDQYLADIWTSSDYGRENNPYASRPNGQADPHFESLRDYRQRPGARIIYSVWRLDAPTPEIASALVDKAISAERQRVQGKACFDRRFGSIKSVQETNYGIGDWSIYRAANYARSAGLLVLEDDHDPEFGTAPAPLRCDGAIIYSGWYSLNHYNDAFSWNNGAIGWHLDSASAASPHEGTNWSTNALKRGITVTSGAIGEPYLPGLPHPDGIVHDLLVGANVGDAFLRNTEWLHWMIINIGDPLYRPFGKTKPLAGR